MNIAIAWLTYNRQDLSDQMERQLTPLGESHPGVDIIVVDNGSTPEIKTSFLNTKKFEIYKNLYFSGGWNHFMVSNDYDYVWMLNDDIKGVDIEMAKGLVTLMKDNPTLLALTPSFNSPHPVFHFNPSATNIQNTSWVDWCCPMVNTNLWKKMGGFDKRFKGYGADLDLCKRSRTEGLSFGVTSIYQLHHLGSQTANSEGKIGEMCCVTEMNRLLKEKWGVADWSQML